MPEQYAVSTNVIVQNFGNASGTVLVSSSSGKSNDMKQQTVTVAAGETAKVPVLTNVTFIQVEELIQPTGNGSGKFNIDVNSKVIPANPKVFAIPFRTIGTPKLEDLIINLGH